MRKRALLAGALASVSAAPADISERRIVYSVPGMDRVRVERDLTYRSAESADLKLDVYSPTGLSASERRPVVFFVHGGPAPLEMRPKDWGVFRSYGELAAASGFVGVTFNHRLRDLTSYDRSAEDLAAAVEFVRRDAARFHVDPERTAVWVFSGGGPLLASAFRQPVRHLKAVVSYYAFLDAPARAIESGTGPFPPMLIARAGQDDVRINASVEAFVKAAWAKGLVLDVLNHAAGQHAFDILDDDDRSREVIRRTVEFLRERLKR